jgi:uncharacterized membrane protein
MPNPETVMRDDHRALITFVTQIVLLVIVFFVICFFVRFGGLFLGLTESPPLWVEVASLLAGVAAIAISRRYPATEDA